MSSDNPEDLSLKIRLAAHELNGSLSVIVGRAAVLLRRYGDSEIAMDLEQILSAAKSAAVAVAELNGQPKPFTEPKTNPHAPSRDPRSGRVVIVDNDAALGEMIVQVLEPTGIEALAFDDPRKALDYIGEHGCDLVISDVNMPGMDGPAFKSALRTDHPDLEFVFMSGAPLENEPCMTKPFSRAELISCIRDAMLRKEESTAS